jgi:hypothetical protein
MTVTAIKVMPDPRKPKAVVYTIWVDGEIATREMHLEPEVRAEAAAILRAFLKIFN